MTTLYIADICPYAQRPRALLTHLGAPFEERPVDLERRDPGFLELSPTGLVPLLLDGDLKLYESQVIIEYLAGKLHWKAAFSENPEIRARQKLAMKQWDGVISPAWYRTVLSSAPLDARTRVRAKRELDELAETIHMMHGSVESLLAIHCAPFWARMSWLREYSPVPEMVDERPALRRWLDTAAALPAIQKTLPDRDTAVQAYLRRREAAATN